MVPTPRPRPLETLGGTERQEWGYLRGEGGGEDRDWGWRGSGGRNKGMHALGRRKRPGLGSVEKSEVPPQHKAPAPGDFTSEGCPAV